MPAAYHERQRTGSPPPFCQLKKWLSTMKICKSGMLQSQMSPHSYNCMQTILITGRIKVHRAPSLGGFANMHHNQKRWAVMWMEGSSRTLSGSWDMTVIKKWFSFWSFFLSFVDSVGGEETGLVAVLCTCSPDVRINLSKGDERI